MDPETRPTKESPPRSRYVRQTIVRAAGAGIALAGISGCRQFDAKRRELTGTATPTFTPAAKHPNAPNALLALNRVAYGPRPGDVQRVAEMGIAAYIEEQLADSLPESRAAMWHVNGLDVQEEVESSPDTLESLSDEQLLTETVQAALLRAVYSTHQLRETLADFWTNHFNIFALKNDERVLIPVDSERVIRPHLLGKFRDMLTASAHSPAMLSYLDNQLNRKGVANENYARELLELHTLGVHSGYTQKDIQEVARCFTGWRVHRGFVKLTLQNIKEPYNAFEYRADLHDDEAKYIPFLNLTIAPNGGQKDADTILERLAMHPATARFLATKICRRYLGHTPDDVIAKAVNAYLKSDTDIRVMLRPILLDTLPNASATKPILKRPLEFMASALRTFGAETDGGANVQRYLTAMGQPLYQWPMPDGFPEKPSAWTGSLLGRWNYALALTSNTIGGTNIDLPALAKDFAATTDDPRLNALIETVLNRPADAPDLRPLHQQIALHVKTGRQANVPENALFAEAAGLLLSAPAFQWR